MSALEYTTVPVTPFVQNCVVLRCSETGKGAVIDPGGDIALLKLIDDKAFSAVPLGESDSLKPGERVFAMGNPFLLAEDFSPTVTQGVVSGIHRYRDATGGSDLVYGDYKFGLGLDGNDFVKGRLKRLR